MNSIILGISSFTYGWNVSNPGPEGLREEDLIELACANEFTCVQVADNLPVHAFDEERKQGLRRLVRDKGMRLELGARGLTEEHLATYLDLASYFGSTFLRFVIDGHSYAPPVDDITAIIRNQLSTLHARGIYLGIENHDRFKASQLITLMDRINDSYVGVCLDTANSLGAGEGLEQVATALARYALQIHYKDFTIRRLAHQMGFIVEGAPAGSGMIDQNFLTSVLPDMQHLQSIILEQWVVPEQLFPDTLQKEKVWATQSMAFLKNYISNSVLSKTFRL